MLPSDIPTPALYTFRSWPTTAGSILSYLLLFAGRRRRKLRKFRLERETLERGGWIRSPCWKSESEPECVLSLGFRSNRSMFHGYMEIVIHGERLIPCSYIRDQMDSHDIGREGGRIGWRRFCVRLDRSCEGNYSDIGSWKCKNLSYWSNFVEKLISYTLINLGKFFFFEISFPFLQTRLE